MISLKSLTRIGLGCAVLIMACKSEKKGDDSFFTFEHHVRNEGVKPVDGDLVSFQIEAYVGDSLVQSSTAEAPNRLKIPQNSENYYKQNPLYFAFKQMSEKDSATIIVEADSLENRPPFAISGGKIRYNIVLVGIQSGGLRDITEEGINKLAVERARSEASINAANRLEQTIASWNEVEATGTREKKMTTSGIEYLVIAAGNKPLAASNEWVSFHYLMKAEDGTVLVNTFRDSKPNTVLMGSRSKVAAIDELFTLVPVGSVVVAKIPASLGYKGNEGEATKEGNQTMILEVVRVDPYNNAIQQ